jgi:hypothetical protein
MKSLNRFVLLVAVLFVSACTSLPETPRVEINRGDKVGILVSTGDLFHHVHIGTTIFNNSSKTYPMDELEFRSRLEQAIASKIADAGYLPVVLPSSNAAMDEASNLVSHKDGNWQVSPAKQATINKFRNDLGLKTLIVLKHSKAMVEQTCGQFGCNEFYVPGPGMFTRSFFTLGRSSAVAAFNWSVISFTPTVDLVKTKSLAGWFGLPARPMSAMPQDTSALTNDEIEKAKTLIVAYVQDATSAAMKNLNAGR